MYKDYSNSDNVERDIDNRKIHTHTLDKKYNYILIFSCMDKLIQP